MAVAVLLLILLSAFAGLVAGRRSVVAAAAIAVIPSALLGGPEIAGLALLAAAGLAAGVHLHRVVAETSVPRAG
jgi:LytS/YehU family sensor histidine kinase